MCEHGSYVSKCMPCKLRRNARWRWSHGYCQPKKSLLERFEAKYIPEPMSGCWIWISTIGSNGYGEIHNPDGSHKGKQAHRVSWEFFRGPITEGLQVNHKCDVPLCVNPNHLYLGTQVQNIEDCIRRGRARKRPFATHCSHGHEYTPQNAYRPPSGGVYCRICIKLRYEASQLRRKAKLI